MTWLSPDGQELWERTTDEYPVAAVGDIVVLRDCDEDGWCEFRGVDGHENVVFEYGTDGDPLPKLPHWLAPATSRNIEGDWSRTPRSVNLPEIAVIEADGETATVLDAQSGTIFEIDSVTDPAISGDVIMHRVSKDADAESCEMVGTLVSGQELWGEEMPCSSWGLVIEDRYYGAIPNDDDDEELQDTLTVDLLTGKWRQHKPAKNWNSGHDSQTSTLGADLIIERNDRQLTAVDPDTGDELWRTTIPGERIPGISIAHGGVTTLNNATPTLNPFTAHQTGASIRVLDGRTGETVSQYVRGSVPWETIPVGPDRAIVNDVGRIILLGR